MAIQWFPGHMHLTRKAIGERIKDIDVVIELLDARLPGSSSNPLLAEDVCAVAFDAGPDLDKCVQTRKDLDPANVPAI